MIEINWNKFEVKNPKATDAFENMCYFLFCRKYGMKEGIRTDFNQVGLETEPILIEGKYYGFQSKYFAKNINYTNIENSIDKALKHYDNLNHIVIYLNQEAQTSCDTAKSIETKCKDKGITIEWYLPNNFKIALNQPSNLDLAQFYFGESDILGFISDGKNLRMSTLLQSKEYLELFLHDSEKSISVTEYSNKVIQSEKKLHLLCGAAGTGKSVCMSRLLHIYGGFEETTQEKQQEQLQLIGAIPIYINLNSTSSHSLGDIIKYYKKDFLIEEQSNRFIYLFDGLDEIPRDKINLTLLFIEELLMKKSTKKIVVSTRLSSYNKYILKSTFFDFDEYIIAELNDEQIHQYFINKENKKKIEKLSMLTNENPKLINNVQDILTLSLLWNHIEKISKSSSLTNLMKYSVSEMMRNIHHRKNLELLNLPNPKEDSIIELNKKIAFWLFERDLLSVGYPELYDIIGSLFPKCDYNSLNEIIGYLTDCFFDITTTNESYHFAYQHRRLSEYFTMLELEKKIKEDLNYFRTQNIIINTELFDEMLIPYLKDKALEEKDLPLAFLVGLFNVYLGNDRAWGIEKSFYYWSDWIILAMVSQNNEIFESIIHDQSLPYHEFFNHIPKRILKHLSNESIRPSNDELRQFLKIYVSLLVHMDKFDKQSYLHSLMKTYDEIIKLVKEKNYHINSISNKDSNSVWRNITYINTIMKEDDIDVRIDTAIENFQDTNIDDLFSEYIRTELLYLSSLYYNLILHHIDKCPSVVKRINLNQLSVFIITMAKPECIKKVFENEMLLSTLKELCEKEVTIGNLSGVMIISLKITLGLEPLEKEIELVQEFFDNNKLRDSSIFWKDHCDTVGFMLNAFDDNVRNNIDSSIMKYGKVYSAFIKLITKSCSISRFVRIITPNLFNKSEGDYYIRILLGKALALADDEDIYLKGAIDYVNRMLYNSGILVIYYNMKLHNSDRFEKLLSASDLNKLCKENIYKDIDFISTSDSLFILSFIISKHNDAQSYDLLLKGISNGILRMNDRKDTIGDYRLIESLRVLLDHNWISTDRLKDYLTRILKITEVMDSHHIENDTHRIVMKLLNKYNFDAAQFYYEKIAPLNVTYNQIHLEYATAMVHRGIEINQIEKCMKNITAGYDRYHQRVSWDSFYYKIEVYLNIANTDFYLEYEQTESFKKACEEIQSLSDAGWERELIREEYEIYIQLCDKYDKEVDVQKRREYEYTTKNEEKLKVSALDNLKIIEGEVALNEFFKKIESNCLLDNFEVNDLLVEKCLCIYGNIDAILEFLTKLHYPSSAHYTYNSSNLWMTVVSALINEQTKNIMIDYLIKNGGGHDGFSELIKIYGYLNNKEICTNAFDSMLRSIEFLLC
ncbi:MAG: NACHT domain-containing protein [Eubacteriales bacterium]